MSDDNRIGRLLVERGVVDDAAVEQAALGTSPSGGRLCSRLLEMGACDEGDLVKVLAERHGVPGIDLSRSVIDLSALDLVPRAVAEADVILPLSSEGDRIHLATSTPEQDERTVAEVRFVTGKEVSPYIAILGPLKRAIASCYDVRERGAALWRGENAPPLSRPSLVVHLPPSRGAQELPALSPDDLLEEVPVAEFSIEVPVQVEEPAAPHPAARAPGRRLVLVVDDEPAIRLLAQRALEHRGYEVVTAQDGAEALEKARSARPDLVLLDAMLPRLHGFEVARQLRSDAATRSIPVVIMTAVYRGWRFAQDARQSFGAQDYVEKPFRVDDLLRRIDAVLESAAAPVAQGSAEPMLERGRAAQGAGDLDTALREFEQATQVDPFSADAHRLLGDVLLARGDAFSAMTALERAVELRPTLFPALRSLTGVYLTKGFRAKAAETIERAVAAAPDPTVRDALRRELMRLV